MTISSSISHKLLIAKYKIIEITLKYFETYKTNCGEFWKGFNS